MRFLRTALWLLLAVGLMGQATPTATPTPTGPAYCTINGAVYNPDGTAFIGSINFNSKTIQVINGWPVYPTIVNTVTDVTGTVAAVALPQGIVMSVTMCPSRAQAAGCAAPFSAIVPFATTATLGQMAQGTNLTGTSALNLTTLNVSQQLNFPDGSTYTTAGHNNMKALGIGAPAPDGANGAMLQATSNGNHPTTIALSNAGTGSGANETYYVGNDIPHYGALQLTNTGFTAGGALVSGDEMVVGTNAANGVLFNTADAGSRFNYAIGGSNVGYIDLAGIHYVRGVNAGVELSAQNPDPGTSAEASVALRSSDHTVALSQLGPGFNANPFFAPDSSILETDAPNLYIGSYVGTTNIYLHLGGLAVASVVNSPPQISGIKLGGYAAPVNGNYGIPAIMLGNAYLSATGWANLNISGAAYQRSDGYWIADGGMGSGGSLFQVGPGGAITAQLVWSGPVAAGGVVTWNQNTYWLPSGMNVTHIENAQGYGVPSCINCGAGQLNNGSRDNDGYMQTSGTYPMQLNFAKAFTGTATCVGSALGVAAMIWFGANATTSIQVYCTTPGGAACGGGVWVAYHCFGNGA